MTNRFDINRSQRGIPAFSVLLIMAALAVIGVAMLPMLNVQYTPSPVERKIDVSFTWPDASARLIEQSVTSRIEGALSAITGSESVSSRSSKGSGRVTIRFRKGTEMAAARFEVASAIRNLYPKLPEEVSYPAISIATGGTRESDMLVYTIKADLPSRRIEEYVEAHMSTPLSQTEGVGKVSLSGVTPFEWVITFDPKAMEVNGISAADLAAAFRDYFRSDVIGLTTLPHADGTDRSIVLKLRNRASLNFGDIPIARRNGRIYHLRDFATARWCEAPPSTYFRINGLNTISLSIGCEASTNMLRVAENVKEEMQRLQAAFLPGISATLTYDASEYVSGIAQNLSPHASFCVAILMLFLVYSCQPGFQLPAHHRRHARSVNILVAVVFYNLLNLTSTSTRWPVSPCRWALSSTLRSSWSTITAIANRRVRLDPFGALLTTIEH